MAVNSSELVASLSFGGLFLFPFILLPVALQLLASSHSRVSCLVLGGLPYLLRSIA